MKKGFIFATTLAMVLGMGVAVGAHETKVAEVKAETTSVTLAGSFNSWSTTANPLTLSGDYWTIEHTFAQNDTFKLVVNGNIWVGDGDGVTWCDGMGSEGKGGNFKVLNAGTYVIKAAADIGGYDDKSYGVTFELPAATEYTVTCVVDGNPQAPVKVAEGSLPANPAAQFGKEFSGWCSDSDCKTPIAAITSDTTVYGKFTPLPTVIYSVDNSYAEYEALYLYAFEDAKGTKNAEWPGKAISATFEVPNDASFVINDGADRQTVDVTQSGVANDILKIRPSVDGSGHNYVAWKSAVDEPDSDGYYIVGSFNNNKYAGAIKMSDDPSGDNDAIYVVGFHGVKDDTFKVRFYQEERAEGSDVWGFFEANEYSEGLGDADINGNFVFSKECDVDVYAKWVEATPDNWEIHFFVREHVNTYIVNVVVDGGEPVPEQVEEGALPVKPAEPYGKSFDGWYSDALYEHKIAAITENTTVYGRFVNTPTMTYTIDDSRDVYDEIYVYAFKSETAINADWPGVEVDKKTKSITVPEDVTIVINNNTEEGEGHKQTVNVAQSGVANDVLRILAERDEMNCNKVVWESNVDEPAEDGYYLISSKTGYHYAGATKMVQTEDPHDVAYLYGYEPEPGEAVKVRSYFSEEDKYSACTTTEVDYGAIDKDLNFAFDENLEPGATFDIYAYYIDSDFLFSVVPHTEKYTVTVVAKQFAGAQYQGETSALATDTVVEGNTYNVTASIPDGYVSLGVYSDFDCTVPFVSGETVVTSNMTLHIKCMQLGYYLAGGEDSTFSVETATKLSSTESDKMVGAVTVPAGTDADHPFKVKPLEFVANRGDGQPGWASASYALGDDQTYSFVKLDEESNFVFVTPGTYSFYVNYGNDVWFGSGEYAFHEAFLSQTAAQCDGVEGKSTNIEALQSAWEDLEELYDDLDPAEKAAIEAVTMEGGDQYSSDARLRMVARYAYIVNKYGTKTFKDFIWGQNIAPKNPLSGLDISNNLFEGNSAIIIVISIAATSALAFSLLLVFKKKKQK